MRKEKFVLLSGYFMTTPAKLSPAELTSSLSWRYATKTFDSTKTIPAETWKALEESLILTPSSCGLQPWKFIVITDKALREKLQVHSWNQTQVSQCSHYVVLARVEKIDETYVDHFLSYAAEKRSMPVESLKGFRGMIVGGLKAGTIGSPEWSARQVYIALGNFMTSAATLGIDTCPMEGFVPAEYDQILGLKEKGLASVVCCAAGYRSTEDKYASVPKVRFPANALIEHI
jgi:nitroreductase